MMAQELSNRSLTVPAMLSEDSFTSSNSAFAPYAGTKGAAPVVGDTLPVYYVLLFADNDNKVDLEVQRLSYSLTISTRFACLWQLHNN